ncbi:TPA: argininosuccinate synthase [Candidatus Saccharibacteria bacterium]|nr:MAG: Argininosuccinate synthase [Candidatus Saccharibacteria bacterium GW2011_GWA2_46_10]OGL35795.1 MAG: argininosuccinate synthase [Candidatus Saccharibacteria bacterium RIFCSPHIGHO2_12_FULL_47_17]HCM52215.1 argininosuccinate synthase [Candidatus Saccharibacteria bacterium]
MKSKNNYFKVASYEAKVGEVKKILLLYSGGLDTSVMLKWIKDHYKAEVIALTLDLGQQHDDLEAVKQKALKLGALKAITLDVKDEFANEYLAKGIKANASYQGDYHLSTPIGRAILAKKAVEVATKEKADAVAHGCTGKGNDQVRIEGYILSLNPKMKIVAPVREWAMDRNEEIKYAKKNGIAVPASLDFPYSVDDNMWGMTWEGGEIEDPSVISPVEKFLTTYNLAKNAPDKEEFVKLDFVSGIPTKLNGKKMGLSQLILKLNMIAGKHGVGVVHMFEDRLVGVKNGGVYELPAAHVIVKAHQALERYVCTRQLNELKAQMDIKWGYLCYGALWYDPVMKAINAFNDFVNQKVTGQVRVKLYKGVATVVTLNSPFGLDHSSFTNEEGYDFNVNAASGFIEIYSLQMKLSNQAQTKKPSA